MKCVLLGDIFIPPEIMEKAVSCYQSRYDIIKKFYFGTNDRKQMREIVKTIEEKGRYAVQIPEGVLEEIKDADVIMTHLCPITKEMIDACTKLKVILSNRGGLENIDLKEAKERNIPVFNNPSHNANAVAEYTVGLILCEQRNIVRSHISLINNKWRENYPNSNEIRELGNCTIGLIGYGNVGKLVSEKLSGFKPRILAYDPYIGINTKVGNVELVTLEYLLKEADIVSLHARTSDKKPLITKKELSIMKNSAYLINTARSYLINMDDLYLALKERKICGAAVDVFEIEPLPEDYKFLDLENVTLTNHRGGDTINSYFDSPMTMFNIAERYLKKGEM